MVHCCRILARRYCERLCVRDLSHNQLQDLPPGLFSSLYYLQRLDLSNNQLKNLTPGVFDENNYLTKLDLSYNELEQLPPKAFYKNEWLEEIFLNNNNIKNLSSDQLPHKYWEGEYRFKNLTLDFNKLETLPSDIFKPFKLKDLWLGNNNLKNLSEDLFTGQDQLKYLRLSGNRLEKLPPKILQGLSALEELYIYNNSLVALSPDQFQGLSKLEELVVYENNINYLPREVFKGMKNIMTMSFYFNNIRTVTNEQFKDVAPSIRFLYFHYNEMRELPEGFFSNMKYLITATVDTNLMCCHLTKQDADCDFAYVDSFASCETLFRNRAPRECLWVVGIMSLVGAVFVIVWRLVFKEKKKKNKIQSIMLIHLAGADGLMGVYLITIGVVDAIWAGEYYLHDYYWRSSLTCQITGAIAVLSSEVSVMTICLLSADRMKNILFPYRGKSLTLKVTHLLCFLIWIVGVIIAFIPTVGFDYFGSRQKGHHFYGRSVVCLPLQLSTDKPSGWEYSVAMFVGLNFTLVLFVVVAYAMIIYKSCASNRRMAQQGTERERRMKAKARAADLRREASLAKRVFFIVLTDCVCWMPIVVIGMRSLVEKSFRTPGDLAVWIAVFVLPVNSAINPILYTLSTVQVRRVLKAKFQQLWSYLVEKCGRNQNNEGQDQGVEMKVIEEVQIQQDAESDDSDDSDEESRDQSEHEQNAEQAEHEEPEERAVTEQEEKPEEDHEDPSELKDETSKQEEESENEFKECEEEAEDNMEHGPDKQKEQLEKEFTECEEQEEDNMEDEAGEGDELIVNKDKHQADDNRPAASGRESPRAPLATFDDDSDLDFFYPALDGIKETSV